MANKIRVVAAVVDTRNLTLYLEDGTTILVPQGDIRLEGYVKAVTPGLLRKEVVELDLEPAQTSYAEFEQKSSGIVKFFRMTKKAVADFFSKKEAPPVDPIVLGQAVKDNNLTRSIKETATAMKDVTGVTLQQGFDVETKPVADRDPDMDGMNPAPTTQVGVQEPAATPAEKRMNDAVASIMAHKAVPVTNHDFKEGDIGKKTSEHTMVAVVGGTVMAGVEALKPQMIHAVSTGNATGMENFMKRVAAVAEKRRHSVDDLLKFMKRGDLPVADDGSIVIYKVLKTGNYKGKATWVDCHTGNVPQQIGSYVMMDESMVDHNRNNECSNGLHVARRGYLSSFSGNVMVLAKVAPEDVIAVPQYDANKMRVCGYHILFQLDDADAALLRSGKPMTENRVAAQMLTKALRGDHVGKLEEVRITQQQGGGIQITSLVQKGETKHELKKTKVDDSVETSNALPDHGDEGELLKTGAAPLDPTKVAASIEAARTGTEATQASTEGEKPAVGAETRFGSARKDHAAKYWAIISDQEKLEIERKDAAETLMRFKKVAKVGWDALGLSESQAEHVLTTAGVVPQGKVDRTKEPKKAAKPVKAGKYKTPKAKVKPPVKAAPVKKSKPAKAPAPAKVPAKVVDQALKKLDAVDNSVKKSPAGGPSAKILALLPTVQANDARKGSPVHKAAVAAAVEIGQIKKAAKKAYSLLGVPANDEAHILLLIAESKVTDKP